MYVVFVLFLNALSILGWCLLFSWYSVRLHINTPFFAMDKIPGHFSSPLVYATIPTFFLFTVAYLLTYFYLIKPQKNSSVVIPILCSICVVELIFAVFIYPFTASDIFNYIAELKILYFYHQNPYLITFANYPFDPFFKFSFYQRLTLFYGPAWLIISAIPVKITGMTNLFTTLIGLKIFNVLLLVLSAINIYYFTGRNTRSFSNAYLFFANPLVIFEAVTNAHNDIMITFFLTSSLLLLNRKSILSLPLLAISFAVKFFTISLLPLFLLVLLKNVSREKFYLSVLLSLVTLSFVSAPFWAHGQIIRSLIYATSASQQMYNVSLLSLVKENITHNQFLLEGVFMGLFILLAVAILLREKIRGQYEIGMVDTLLLFSILITLLYQWYFLPIFALICFKPNRRTLSLLFTITLFGLVSYPLSVWAWFNSQMQIWQIHLFLSAFLLLPCLIYLFNEAYRFRKHQLH